MPSVAARAPRVRVDRTEATERRREHGVGVDGTDREITARERLITNHITFRNFDRSRITLVRGGDRGNGPETRLYRIPPGAANPNP